MFILPVLFSVAIQRQLGLRVPYYESRMPVASCPRVLRDKLSCFKSKAEGVDCRLHLPSGGGAWGHYRSLLRDEGAGCPAMMAS